MENLKTLQAGRGLAALAVVLFHLNVAIFGTAKYWPDEITPLLRAGNSGVEFFFVLSGFIMVLVHRRDVGKPGAAWQFLMKRFRRVYPPFWVALAGILAAKVLVPTLRNAGDLSPEYMVASTFLLPTDRLPLLDVAWTLQLEIQFYAFLAVLLWRPRLGLPLMLAWLCGSIILAFLPAPYPFTYVFSKYNLLFLFGMVAALATPRLLPALRWPLIASGSALFIALWLQACFGERTVFTIWGLGLGAALLITGAVVAERQGEIRIPSWLDALGAISFSLYLVHFPVLSFGAKLLFAANLATMLPPLASFAILLVLALAAGAIFFLLVEQPLLAIWSKPGADRGLLINTVQHLRRAGERRETPPTTS